MFSEKCQEVYRTAASLYEKAPDWVTFFREVLGVEGLVRQAFPETDTMTAFEKSQEFDDIQLMLAKLREKNEVPEDDSEPTRVITVRLPKSLHEALRAEAHDRRTSMNKLCISKLLQIVDQELVPAT